MELVCGIDVGTSGARVVVVAPDGQVIARAEAPFEQPPYQPAPGLAEQDALEWWRAVQTCLHAIGQQVETDHITALAVDSTSGTFVPVDSEGKPLMPALMYNDGRAKGLEGEVNAAAQELCDRLGYTFPPAFALVKMLWLARNQPDMVAKTHKFLHAADFVVAQLTGNFCTDTSNALKTGVDLLTGAWLPFMETHLGLPLEKFPQVFRPGDAVGVVSSDSAALTGLRAGTVVVAGVSDGTATFLASGAKAVGDWNLTIGTTLVTRGVAKDLIRDPQGRLYCHRHPEGYWLPGGASNVGGEALLKVFGREKIKAFDPQAVEYLPTELTIYPLVRQGERMPFVSHAAQGFVNGTVTSEAHLFAGYLEGIALVTAWSMEVAAELGAPTQGEFFLSGGGAHGQSLGKVIASAVQHPLVVVQEPDGAMGSAYLAAGWAWHGGSVSAAQAHMIQRAEVFEPMPHLIHPLHDKLQEFKKICWERGYL